MRKNKFNISEKAFRIIEDSVLLEGFNYDASTVFPSGKDYFKTIDKDTVVAFLECPDTKVVAIKTDSNNYELVATNNQANESIRISGLGNHFIALVRVVLQAKKQLANPTEPKITNNFIKSINEQLLLNRMGEVAIGSYRYKDFWGRDADVSICSIENGRKIRQSTFNTEPSADKNVYKKMDELVNWVNNDAFKDSESIMYDIAKFHSTFIRIHQFRDGNGRTARLLTNYLLLINGYPLVNIPPAGVKQYHCAINYAEATTDKDFCRDDYYNNAYAYYAKRFGKRDDVTKYCPLADFFERHLLESSNTLINNIINYKNTQSHIESTQIQ